METLPQVLPAAALLCSPLFHRFSLFSPHLFGRFSPPPLFQSDQSPRLPKHKNHPSAPMFRLSHAPHPTPLAFASCSFELLLVTQAKKGIPYPQLLATPMRPAYHAAISAYFVAKFKEW
jgi:hypothetical protein